MKSLGPVLLVVGVLLILLGVVNHFVKDFIMPSTQHISIIIGVVGLVIAAAGLFLFRQGSNA